MIYRSADTIIEIIWNIDLFGESRNRLFDLLNILVQAHTVRMKNLLMPAMY